MHPKVRIVFEIIEQLVQPVTPIVCLVKQFTYFGTVLFSQFVCFLLKIKLFWRRRVFTVGATSPTPQLVQWGR